MDGNIGRRRGGRSAWRPFERSRWTSTTASPLSGLPAR